MTLRPQLVGCACIAVGFLAANQPSAVSASDCTVTSVGFTPLNDLGAGFYSPSGTPFQGGLYPGGSNLIPAAHGAIGRSRALAIRALPKYLLLSIGMSNTTQEYCSAGGGLPCDAWTFMGQSLADPRVNTAQLRMVNGAAGGQAASTWDSPTDPNYDRVRDMVLAPQGHTEADVYVIWVKVANPGPTIKLPNAGADAFTLKSQTANILRSAKIRYPNLLLAFVSSRIYAGYAGYPIPTASALNPEPYAYESGFAMKWLIEAQITQMSGGPIDPIAGDMNYNTVAPWVAWGPYLWADGTTPRSDGLTYICTNLDADGTHPSMTGEQKVGTMLRNFMLTDRAATPWFRKCELADMNVDGVWTTADIASFVTTVLQPGFATAAQLCAADCNEDGLVNGRDVGPFVKVLLGP
ncbi:MAG: hypothetical protein HZA51_01615 [Planctomycetes bacterium]|nr:hypothetical protein [Planctomycetota bacterium]